MRVVAAVAIVLATVCLVVGILVVGLTESFAANRDFIEYWAAGQQLIHHANPYDAVSTLTLERAAGLKGNEPQVTFSPPVGLFMILPLGFVTPKTGIVLWTLLLMGCLLISVWLLWILNGRSDSGLHFCGYMFPPAIACFMAGQLGIFLLLAIVLFLYLHTSHPYLAGAALLPCVWKPHLFLPFFIVLFLWSLVKKEARILASFSILLIASCGVTLFFDPQVWSQYSQMMMARPDILHGFVPTLSVTLRFLIAPRAVWLQYIPEVAACVWGGWYFWSRRQRWVWMDQGMLLLLISAICTPYAWFTDEAVLLPAVLAGAYRAVEARRSLIPIAVIGSAALIEICAFGHIASKKYLWTVPAWLAWYLYATWATRKQPATTQEVAEGSAH